MERSYPIGIPGQPWNRDDEHRWLASQNVQRSYRDEVVEQIDQFAAAKTVGAVRVTQYGQLPIDRDRYPLYAVEIVGAGHSADTDLPWALITGGVHGYETSGVRGALALLRDHAADYIGRLNLLVAPCVSPWGYEVINRWNPDCIDPNRSFVEDSPSEEAAALMRIVADRGHDMVVHLDLHETTDSDEDEFRPALAARDGLEYLRGTIPDGFYTVGDSANPQPDFQAAIIAGVERVTHIAPADDAGQIIGSDVTQPGVINYPVRALSLCAGITNARFTTTTEVYPDSPTATPQICIDAQIAAVRAGLDHAIAFS